VAIFSTYEMIWECASGVMCQCRGVDTISNGQSLKGRVMKAVKEGSDSAFAAWWEISTYYFSCDITRPADRLPAVAGLARWFSEADPNLFGYCSGLWERHFLVTLLWNCELALVSRRRGKRLNGNESTGET
jgi:hypothetical protein